MRPFYLFKRWMSEKLSHSFQFGLTRSLLGCLSRVGMVEEEWHSVFRNVIVVLYVHSPVNQRIKCLMFWFSYVKLCLFLSVISHRELSLPFILRPTSTEINPLDHKAIRIQYIGLTTISFLISSWSLWLVSNGCVIAFILARYVAGISCYHPVFSSSVRHFIS